MSCAFDLDHYAELVEAAKSGGYRFAHFEGGPQPGCVLRATSYGPEIG